MELRVEYSQLQVAECLTTNEMASSNVTQSKPPPEKATDLDGSLQWPFQSRLYDPGIIDGFRTQRYVEELITYGGLDTIDYFEVGKGKGSKSHSR